MVNRIETHTCKYYGDCLKLKISNQHFLEGNFTDEEFRNYHEMCLSIEAKCPMREFYLENPRPYSDILEVLQ